MTPTLNEANLFKIAVLDEKSKQKNSYDSRPKRIPKKFFLKAVPTSEQSYSVTLTEKSQSIWESRDSRCDCLVQFWLLLPG